MKQFVNRSILDTCVLQTDEAIASTIRDVGRQLPPAPSAAAKPPSLWQAAEPLARRLRGGI